MIKLILFCIMRKYPHLLNKAKELVVSFTSSEDYYRFCKMIDRRKQLDSIAQSCHADGHFYATVKVAPLSEQNVKPATWDERYALADNRSQRMMRCGKIA